MTDARQRVSLSRLLDSLGPTLLTPVVPGVGLDADVSGVVIFDPADEPVLSPGDVVLGVGAAPSAALLHRLAAAGAAALIVKAPGECEPAVRDSGVPVLALAAGASWLHVAELARSVLAARDGWDEMARGSNLFAVADTISALVDGPVTIEDRFSHVLAFSGRQEEADEWRIETVLGRQVPQHWVGVLRERGVFDQIARSGEPLYIDYLPDGARPRVVVGVRAGDELLGSIWAAVPGPLSPERQRALADSANVVALHLLRLRVGADVERRLSADLIATVIEGGPRAAESASRLRIGQGSLRVLAGQFLAVDADARGESELHRLRDTLAVHFGVLRPNSATALIGGVIYTVLPVEAGHDDDGARAAALAETVLARLGDRYDAVIAVGAAVPSFTDLPRSRREADRVLRVLRVRHDRRVARMADVRLDSLLLRLADVLAEDHELDHGPIATLRAYDAANQTNLVETLDVYLDVMGNTKAAAQRLRLHPNSLRYRVKRLAEISGLDLDDAGQRLAATLMLRLDTLH